jgi:hypothetical protein
VRLFDRRAEADSEGGLDMKKVIVGSTVFVLTLVALRRFGPALGRLAMRKCEQMMATHSGDAKQNSLVTTSVTTSP